MWTPRISIGKDKSETINEEHMAERFNGRKYMNAGSGTESKQQSPYFNTYVHLLHNLKLFSTHMTPYRT